MPQERGSPEGGPSTLLMDAATARNKASSSSLKHGVRHSPRPFLRYLWSTQNRPLLLHRSAPQTFPQQVQNEQYSTDALHGKEEALRADWRTMGIANRVSRVHASLHESRDSPEICRAKSRFSFDCAVFSFEQSKFRQQVRGPFGRSPNRRWRIYGSLSPSPFVIPIKTHFDF